MTNEYNNKGYLMIMNREKTYTYLALVAFIAICAGEARGMDVFRRQLTSSGVDIVTNAADMTNQNAQNSLGKVVASGVNGSSATVVADAIVGNAPKMIKRPNFFWVDIVSKEDVAASVNNFNKKSRPRSASSPANMNAPKGAGHFHTPQTPQTWRAWTSATLGHPMIVSVGAPLLISAVAGGVYKGYEFCQNAYDNYCYNRLSEEEKQAMHRAQFDEQKRLMLTELEYYKRCIAAAANGAEKVLYQMKYEELSSEIKKLELAV